MNILIIGSGGREHTFAWKLKQSAQCDRLFVAPGNAGTATIAENVGISVGDFDGLLNFCLGNHITMVVVGPEAPLVEGIKDYFKEKAGDKITVIGPDKLGAQLEGSKDFSKQFMHKYNIPTAKFKTFDTSTLEEGLDYIQTMDLPVVLKADGLAAGKGVLICSSYEEAQKELKAMILDQKFGEASSQVLIEEFMDGIELSVFVLTDGEGYCVLPAAKDYKRIGEKDTGLNTGGMGAVSPVIFADQEFLELVEQSIVKPTVDGFKKEGMDYTGFIFIGLMNVNGVPKVIEYNVRMGDPETQVVLPRIKTDLLSLFTAVGDKQLKDIKLEIDPATATTVVMVAGGYPESYDKGALISGLEKVENATVFHAGTKGEQGITKTNGGRVLAVTGQGATLQEALQRAYEGVGAIQWEKAYFRSDIGKDLLSLNQN